MEIVGRIKKTERAEALSVFLLVEDEVVLVCSLPKSNFDKEKIIQQPGIEKRRLGLIFASVLIVHPNFSSKSIPDSVSNVMFEACFAFPMGMRRG